MMMGGVPLPRHHTGAFPSLQSQNADAFLEDFPVFSSFRSDALQDSPASGLMTLDIPLRSKNPDGFFSCIGSDDPQHLKAFYDPAPN